MSLVEILKMKEAGGFSSPDCSEAMLHSMLKECESQQAGQMSLQATQAIQAIRDELGRRYQERQHKGLTQQLSKIHRIDVWILVVGVIAALSGLLLLLLDFLRESVAGK